MLRRILIILVVAVTAALSASAGSPRWESVDFVPSQVAEALQRTPSMTQPVGYTVRDGYIYISGTSPVQVKVFTILGQLISQETLPAGTHRLRMSARGIYLLKLGEATLRVTI